MFIGRLEDKLEKLLTHIQEINVTLAKQAVTLEEHVKRSNLLEEKMAPIEKQFSTAKSIMKIVSWLGAGMVLKMIHAFLVSK